MLPAESADLREFKHLGNLQMLRRESSLRTARRADDPTNEIPRRAPLIGPSDQQYNADVVSEIAALEESRSHQNAVSVLGILASEKSSKKTVQCPSGPPRDMC